MLALTTLKTPFPPHKPLLNNNLPKTKTTKTLLNPTKRFTPRAQNPETDNNNNNDNNNKKKENREEDGGARLKRKWVDMIIDPDPENVIAVGLTGVLAWASFHLLWQLFFISFSVLIAALKYSFIAALLLFILITLL